MRKKSAIGLLLVMLLAVSQAFAEGTSSEPAGTSAILPEAPAPAPAPKAAPHRKIFNINGITWGFEERFRGDAYNNHSDFSGARNDEVRQGTFRTRVWATVPLTDDLDAFVRFGAMPTKKWVTTKPGSNLSVNQPMSQGEILFDQAYLNFKKLPGMPSMSLRVGRFDIQRGDSFIFFDGSSGDGSRSLYFNAFDLAYTRGKQKFEYIGILNPRSDSFFPVINGSPHQNLNEWSEAAIGVYYTNRDHAKTDIDGYYFWKKEYSNGYAPTPTGDSAWTSSNQYLFQPDRHFSLIGGRIVHRLPKDIDLKAEYGYEFGTQEAAALLGNSLPKVNIRAWGGYTYGSKYFEKAKWAPMLRAGVFLMSGTKPGDKKTDGNWDPMFARYPYSPPTASQEGRQYDNPDMSETYIYQQSKEVGGFPAYWTNIKAPFVQVGITPWAKKLQFVFGYMHLNAFQPYAVNPAWSGVYTSGSAANSAFSNGLGRAQIAKARMKFWVNKSIWGYLYYEKAFAGDFYSSANRSNAYFFRTELWYRYNGLSPFKKKNNL